MFFLKQVTPDVQPGTTKMYNWGITKTYMQGLPRCTSEVSYYCIKGFALISVS